MMNIEALKGILISDFLNREGFTPVRQSRGQMAFRAPYRLDKDPSLIVHDKNGVWYDHGEGTGGDIIALALKLYNTTDVSFAVQRLNRLYNNVPMERIPHRNSVQITEFGKAHQIVRIKPLGNNLAITSYLQSRGIFQQALDTKRISEIYYDYINDKGVRKRYFGAGWKNDSDGYDIRSKYGKICIYPKDALFMQGKNERINVFEGMTNFLSAIKEKTASPNDTNIVLNSLSLSKKIIEKIKQGDSKELNLFLDNGTGGDRFTSTFYESFPSLNDKRYLYKGFDDYNQKLMHELKTNAKYRR